MSRPIEKELLQAWVPSKLVEDLQKWADAEDVKRTQLVRRLLAQCLRNRANAVRMRNVRSRRKTAIAS